MCFPVTGAGVCTCGISALPRAAGVITGDTRRPHGWMGPLREAALFGGREDEQVLSERGAGIHCLELGDNISKKCVICFI